MKDNITWQDAINAADKLIELYKQRMNARPELGEHYQKRLAVTMYKRLLAEEALKKSEELRDLVDVTFLR
jgi:hypothetical protein